MALSGCLLALAAVASGPVLALVRMLVLVLVAALGVASGAHAFSAKPALRAFSDSAQNASGDLARNAAEGVGKIGISVRRAHRSIPFNRFRYYDPESGQYASQDPIGLAGGFAFYAYVVDPLTWTDAAGLNGTPTLPERVLLEDGNTRVVHNYGDLAREHAEPIHFHVEENGKQIAKIKADGRVIDGKLSKNATNMVQEAGAKSKLRKAEKKIAASIRASGGMAGGKPFKPGVRGGRCGK